MCDDFKTGGGLTQSNAGWEGIRAPVIVETISRLPCLLQPPPHWRLVYQGYPEKVYLIEGDSAPQR